MAFMVIDPRTFSQGLNQDGEAVGAYRPTWRLLTAGAPGGGEEHFVWRAALGHRINRVCRLGMEASPEGCAAELQRSGDANLVPNDVRTCSGQFPEVSPEFSKQNSGQTCRFVAVF